MTTTEVIEVAIAAVLVIAGIVAFRRDGSQGAVILFIVAALIAIHGLGLMHYRPLPSETGR